MEVDEQALQQELTGLDAETGSETPDNNVEMYEIPYKDQVYKIPLKHEIPIKHNGEMRNAPFDQVLNAWRERSNLQDKYGQLKTEREKYEAERGDLDQFQQLKTKYGAIQDWSEKNPEQWQRLWEIYENKDQHLLGQEGQQDNALVQEIVNLKKEIGGLREFKEEFTRSQEEAQESADVKSVEEDIEKWKTDYPDIDLGKTNVEGISLKAQILKHGIDNELPTFRSAALSYLEPDLFKAAEARGRQETVKGIKRDRQEGILERSNTPFGGKSDFDPLKMEEGARDEAALAELQTLMGKQ